LVLQVTKTPSQQALETKSPSQQALEAKPSSQHKLDAKTPSQQALGTQSPTQHGAEPHAQGSGEIKKTDHISLPGSPQPAAVSQTDGTDAATPTSPPV